LKKKKEEELFFFFFFFPSPETSSRLAKSSTSFPHEIHSKKSPKSSVDRITKKHKQITNNHKNINKNKTISVPLPTP
jgi:hypothetical protein